MDLTPLLAVVGAISGLAATGFSVANHLRETPRIRVQLQWNMATTAGTLLVDKGAGIITTTNIGRRPVFVTHVSLKLPDGQKHLVFVDHFLRAKPLNEGDAPITTVVEPALIESDLLPHARNWRLIRAVASDSTGKQWVSAAPAIAPSWANGRDMLDG